MTLPQQIAVADEARDAADQGSQLRSGGTEPGRCRTRRRSASAKVGGPTRGREVASESRRSGGQGDSLRLPGEKSSYRRASESCGSPPMLIVCRCVGHRGLLVPRSSACAHRQAGETGMTPSVGWELPESRCDAREADLEDRSVGPRRTDADLAAMRLDDRASDREAQAGAVSLVGALRVGAEEAVEDPVLLRSAIPARCPRR